ncbi:MAG: caspase family protein [Thiolinea sp.]
MSGKNYTLIIGIAAYQHIKPLSTSVTNDANSIHTLIANGSLGLYDSANVQYLTDAEATGSAIRAALAKLANNCLIDSTVLIYFSGHGAQILAGDQAGAYLLPVDVRYSSDEELADTAISGKEFSEALRQLRSRRVLVIFDCCHSGGIGEPKSPYGTEIKAGLPDEYYKVLSKGWGRVIIASSRPNEVSYVYQGDKNSLFTKHLVEGLQGKALVTGQYVRIFDLFSYLQPKVTAEQPNQNPLIKAEVEENFPVALVANLPVAAPPKTPEDDYKYDLFLSYRHIDPDQQWVKKTLVPALKEAGLSVCFDGDYKCFRAGEPIINSMQAAVEKSRYTVAIFTPDYENSGFTELENLMAQHLETEASQVASKNKRLIGVLYRDCDMQQLSLRLRYKRFVNMSDPAEFNEGIEQLVYECREAFI